MRLQFHNYALQFNAPIKRHLDMLYLLTLCSSQGSVLSQWHWLQGLQATVKN